MFPLRDSLGSELAVPRAFVRKIVADRAILVSKRGNPAVATPMPHPYGIVRVGEFMRRVNPTKPVKS